MFAEIFCLGREYFFRFNFLSKSNEFGCSKGRNGHIPFRDSKLTRILQSSLGGNARTAIICTMSPARSHVEQTRNTLLFASCAKEVATNAQVNVVMSDKALVKQLQKELARLEGELRSSGSTRPISNSAALLREKDLEIEKVIIKLLNTFIIIFLSNIGLVMDLDTITYFNYL